MITATPSTALAMIQPAFTDAGRLALAGVPGRYRAQIAIPGPRVMSKADAWLRPRG